MMKKAIEDKNIPYVVDVDGKKLLVDPDAVAFANCIDKINCKKIFEENAERVQHFKKRVTERGDSVKNVVILIANVDDPNGNIIATDLMPNFNWQEIRDNGQVPYARGLAGREYVNTFLDIFDSQASKKMKSMPEKLLVVVIDYGVAEIFEV